MDWYGVYRRDRGGVVTLLTREMTRPNGLAFAPDERVLCVAQSDPDAAVVRAFAVKSDGTLGASRVFFDATAMARTGRGLPDGLKVDLEGNVFTTAPAVCSSSRRTASTSARS